MLRDVNVYNGNGTTTANIDVQGYFTTSSNSSGFHAVRSTIADTQNGLGGNGPLGNSSVRDIQVTGGDVPAGATAVFANVIAKNANGEGSFKFYARGGSSSGPAGMTFGPTTVESMGMTIPLDANGGFSAMTSMTVAGTTTQLMIDVQGYFSPNGSTAGGQFTALAPVTKFDATVPASSSVDVSLDGNGVPLYGAGAVAVNVVAQFTSAAGSLKIYPKGGTAPTVSTLPFGSDVGSTGAAALAITSQGQDGDVTVTNSSSQPVTAKVVVQGWFSGYAAFDSAQEGSYRTAAANAGIATDVLERGIYLGPENTSNIGIIAARASGGTATSQEVSFLQAIGIYDTLADDTAPVDVQVDSGSDGAGTGDPVVTDPDPEPMARATTVTCPSGSSMYWYEAWFRKRSLLGTTIYKWHHHVKWCAKNGQVIKFPNRYDFLTQADSIISMGKLEVNPPPYVPAATSTSHKQRELRYCVVKYGCYATTHPWSKINAKGNGTATYSGSAG